jgi:hypothetical protein
MTLKSLVRSLHLLSQPFKLALSLILPSSLHHPRIFSDFRTGKFSTIETDRKSTFSATLSYFTCGVSLSPLATPVTNKPGVVLAEEL